MRLPAERAKEFLEQLKALEFRIDPVLALADLARLYELAGRQQPSRACKRLRRRTDSK